MQAADRPRRPDDPARPTEDAAPSYSAPLATVAARPGVVAEQVVLVVLERNGLAVRNGVGRRDVVQVAPHLEVADLQVRAFAAEPDALAIGATEARVVARMQAILG